MPLTEHTDRTRERATMLNQTVLAAIVLVLSLFAAVGDFPGNLGAYFVAAAVIFALTGVALAVPWNRLPVWLPLILPILDIAAIGLMRWASPPSAFSLLWVFPVIWLAASGGLLGCIIGVSETILLYSIALVVSGTTINFANFLLPLTILAVGATTYFGARRASAQRLLLDKQAVLLASALERSQRQEQLTTEVLDTVDFGVVRLGRDGAVAMMNDSMGRLMRAVGMTSLVEVPLSAPVYDVDGVKLLDPVDMPLRRAMRGEEFDNSTVWVGVEERRRAITTGARQMRDERGRSVGSVVVFRDVTAEMTALRARDRLVASVSHELRTPLTSILGYLDLALDATEIPEGVRRNLEVAQRNGERLLEIVADILAASSSSKSSVDLSMSPEEGDVSKVVAAAAEAWAPRAAERTVSIDASGVEMANAFVDPARLRQVIDNLLSNAVKYNRDGGSVALACASDGTTTWIMVRDTGLGISSDDRERLFERFFRADSSVQGTGLGLAISRDIARAHGGDITVRSTPRVGSTFTIRLPAAPERVGQVLSDNPDLFTVAIDTVPDVQKSNIDAAPEPGGKS